MPAHLAQQYEALKRAASLDLKNLATAAMIADMAMYARTLLAKAEREVLTTRVPHKVYFGLRVHHSSRPINEALFIAHEEDFNVAMAEFMAGLNLLTTERINRVVYSIALSVFAANDIHGVGRKSSATFFEVLIGHCVARLTGVNPRRKVRMPESGVELPTDYVFEMGAEKRKLHLPLKTSTRERAVQAWVHQLVLERIFGDGVYKGILVVSAETKRNAITGAVVEICTPRQLQMFQSRVAKMSRVYYLDPPQAYLDLSSARPRVDVRSFGEMFGELDQILSAE